MPYDPEVHHRHSLRLKGYDYTQIGMYFVTICVQHRLCLFGEVPDGSMHPNEAGLMIQAVWRGVPAHCPDIQMDVAVAMPNHFHGIVAITRSPRAEPAGPQEGITQAHGPAAGSLGRIVQIFKSITTHEYVVGVKEHGWQPFPGKLWQYNYYDHIIRDDDELAILREYIACNAQKWELDQLHPTNPSR